MNIQFDSCQNNHNMKMFLIIVFLIFIQCSCNFSDESKNLSGWHTYINEGGCYKFILINFKKYKDIGSKVVAFKSNNNYVTVCQSDSVLCEKAVSTDIKKCRFFIIDNLLKKVYGPLCIDSFKIEISRLKIKNLDIEISDIE